MPKAKWEEVYRQFPALCKGSKKYKYNGCAAFNFELGKCMKIYMSNGLCSRTIDDCVADMAKIRGGL